MKLGACSGVFILSRQCGCIISFSHCQQKSKFQQTAHLQRAPLKSLRWHPSQTTPSCLGPCLLSFTFRSSLSPSMVLAISTRVGISLSTLSSVSRSIFSLRLTNLSSEETSALRCLSEDLPQKRGGGSCRRESLQVLGKDLMARKSVWLARTIWSPSSSRQQNCSAARWGQRVRTVLQNSSQESTKGRMWMCPLCWNFNFSINQTGALIETMNSENIVSGFLCRRSEKLTQKQRQKLQRSLMDSCIQDEANRLTFYRSKDRKSESELFNSSVKKIIRAEVRKRGNVLLLSEIYEGLRPSVLQAQEDTRSLNREIELNNQKQLKELEAWKTKRAQQHISNTRVDQAEGIDYLQQKLGFDPTKFKEKALQSLGLLDNIVGHKQLSEKEQVYHSNTEKLEETILHQYMQLSSIIGELSVESKKLRGRVERLGSDIERAQHQSQSCHRRGEEGRVAECLDRARSLQEEKRTLVGRLIRSEKIEKRCRLFLKQLFSTLIEYYKELLRTGKDFVKSGLRASILKLLYLKYRPSQKDICDLVSPRTKHALLGYCAKQIEIEDTLQELRQFSALLRRIFANHSRLHFMQGFGNLEAQLVAPEQHKFIAFLRQQYNRKRAAVDYSSLEAQLNNIIEESGLKHYSDAELATAFEKYSIVNIQLKPTSPLPKVRAQQPRSVDPSLALKIADNQAKLRTFKSTSTQMIRAETQKRIKEWYLRQERQLLPAEKEKAVQIGRVGRFFRDRLGTEHSRILGKLQCLRRELKQIEEREVRCQINDFESMQCKSNFKRILILVLGEQEALSLLKKNPIIRQKDTSAMENKAGLDYETLNRVSRVFHFFDRGLDKLKTTKIIL